MSKKGKIFTFIGILGGLLGLVSETALLFTNDKEEEEPLCPYLELKNEQQYLGLGKSEDK